MGLSLDLVMNKTDTLFIVYLPIWITFWLFSIKIIQFNVLQNYNILYTYLFFKSSFFHGCILVYSKAGTRKLPYVAKISGKFTRTKFITIILTARKMLPALRVQFYCIVFMWRINKYFLMLKHYWINVINKIMFSLLYILYASKSVW